MKHDSPCSRQTKKKQNKQKIALINVLVRCLIQSFKRKTSGCINFQGDPRPKITNENRQNNFPRKIQLINQPILSNRVNFITHIHKKGVDHPTKVTNTA